VADTVAFGSNEWLDAYVKLFNENPKMLDALKDFNAKVGYEFTDRPDIIPKYAHLSEGKILDHGEITEDLAMDFVIKANYETWKVMTLGELDPMNALMAGKVKVQGNMAALLKHAEGFRETFEVVQQIPTTFD
jgi:putative sterol carrier protein